MATADGALVKEATAADIYLVENQRRRWIPDAATLLSQWTWASVLTLSNAEVEALPLIEPLPSIIVNGGLVEALGNPAIYVIENGRRRWIPNMATFFDNDFAGRAVQSYPVAAVEAIPLGNALAPSSRMPLDLESDLNAGHFMYTHGALSTRTRKLRATTRTFTVTSLGGFHGAVKVVFADADGTPVGQSDTQRYGVDGRWVGQSDRTDYWEQAVDAALADQAASATLFHTWAPNDNTLEGIINRAIAAAKPLLDLIEEAKGISKTTGPVTAQQQVKSSYPGDVRLTGATKLAVQKSDMEFDVRADVVNISGTRSCDPDNWLAGTLTFNVDNGAGKWIDVVIESTYPQTSRIWQTGHVNNGSSVSHDERLAFHQNKAVKVARWAPGVFGIPGDGGGEVFFGVPNDGDATINIIVTG